MKGGDGFRCCSLRRTSATAYAARSRSAREAQRLFAGVTLELLAAHLHQVGAEDVAACRAWRACLPSSASMLQYSTGTKASISRSRSTTSRTATLCTRPAERWFLLILRRSSGLRRVAHQPVQDAAGLLGVHQAGVDLAGVGKGLVDGALGDLVEDHAMNGLLLDDRVQGGAQVPGDGLALAVGVGGQVDLVGLLGLGAQAPDDVLLLLGDHVPRLESRARCRRPCGSTAGRGCDRWTASPRSRCPGNAPRCATWQATRRSPASWSIPCS